MKILEVLWPVNVFIFMMVVVSCSSFEGKFGEQLGKLERKNPNAVVAVYRVRERGKDYDSNISLFWKERIKNFLSDRNDLRLVDRDENLAVLLEEQRLALSGLTDVEDLTYKVGKLLSADFVLNVDIVNLPDGGESLEYQLLKVDTGEIVIKDEVRVPSYEVDRIRRINMHKFPDDYYKRLIAVKARRVFDVFKVWRRRHHRGMLFSAVISRQALKTYEEKMVEKFLIKSFMNAGGIYRANFLGESRTFPDRLRVYRTLDNELYGHRSYMILFLTSHTDKETVRVHWEIVSHGKPRKLFLSDELVIEK